MTVRELIKRLQDVPDSMKDCEIETYQYNQIYDTSSPYGLEVKVLKSHYHAEVMSIEKAEKEDGYKIIVLM